MTGTSFPPPLSLRRESVNFREELEPGALFVSCWRSFLRLLIFLHFLPELAARGLCLLGCAQALGLGLGLGCGHSGGAA